MAKGKLVPFPFDDLSGAKVRPSLCLTDEIGPFRQVVLAFLTSQTPPDPQPTDLLLAPTHPDFIRTGLRGPGTVRLHRLATTSATRILRELGDLSPGLQLEIDNRLRGLFGL